MSSVNFKTEFSGSVESAVSQVTAALQSEGFGVLTRINFHSKIRENLSKDLPPTVILGSCNPSLAYEAFLSNPDVTSLLPCNVVVREIAPNRVSIEIAKPSALMEILNDPAIAKLARTIDGRLEKILDRIIPKAA